MKFYRQILVYVAKIALKAHRKYPVVGTFTLLVISALLIGILNTAFTDVIINLWGLSPSASSDLSMFILLPAVIILAVVCFASLFLFVESICVVMRVYSFAGVEGTPVETWIENKMGVGRDG